MAVAHRVDRVSRAKRGGALGAPDAPVAPDVEARVQELLRRPYAMVVRGEPGDGYLAEAPELPGCVTAGETPEEAMAMLRDAMYGWLLVQIERGVPIPEPAPALAADAYSGKFNLRVPKHLHRDLAELAERDGVSLNTLTVGLIERAVGAVKGLGQDAGPVR